MKSTSGALWVGTLVCVLFQLAWADEDVEFLKALDAANQGDRAAQIELGTCYRQGKGTLINPEKAFSWYKKAADSGSARAKALLGEL